MGRSSRDYSGLLTRLYVVTAALVAGLSFAWSELSNDPECTEGPCRQDGPLIIGAALEAVLLLLYLLAMILLAVKVQRGHPRGTNEGSRDGRDT
jgi:hypothetical protein